MDDHISSFESAEEAATVLKQLTQIYQDAKMHLHKICSNSTQVLETVPPSDRAKTLEINDADTVNNPSGQVKALGITWDADTDTLTYQYTKVPAALER